MSHQISGEIQDGCLAAIKPEHRKGNMYVSLCFSSDSISRHDGHFCFVNPISELVWQISGKPRKIGLLHSFDSICFTSFDRIGFYIIQQLLFSPWVTMNSHITVPIYPIGWILETVQNKLKITIKHRGSHL